MSEPVIEDTTDAGTLRPKVKPLPKAGTCFQPMKLDDFDFEVHMPEDCSPEDPISLFIQYYSPDIVDTIVSATNAYQRDARTPASRAAAWEPTCAKEIYLYLAFCIYMTVFPLNAIEDYWSTKKLTPFHRITSIFSRNRFQELRRRFRITNDDTLHLYQKTEPLNSHIQATNLRFWKPGQQVAVDEAMQRYTGRSKFITTIPGKPTPTGIKIWVLAQRGFFLQWAFHTPGKKGGAYVPGKSSSGQIE